jgi:hypothetical protein
MLHQRLNWTAIVAIKHDRTLFIEPLHSDEKNLVMMPEFQFRLKDIRSTFASLTVKKDSNLLLDMHDGAPAGI